MSEDEPADDDVLEGGPRTRLPPLRRPRWSARRDRALWALSALALLLAGSGVALGHELGHNQRPRATASARRSPSGAQTRAAPPALLTSPLAQAAAVPPPDPTTSVGGGYAKDERFCPRSPIRGEVDYVVAGRNASLQVHLAGLPPKADIGVDWTNDPVRGYYVGYFETSAGGRSDAASTRFFRAGEVRGTSLLLTIDEDSHVFAVLQPCG